MSFARIWAIASNGFREIIRDRILYLIGFFALLLVLAVRLLPEIAAATEDKIFIDFGLGVIDLLSVIVAVFVGASLINKEIDKRTVLVLIPKPLLRAELIVGKHLGLSAVLAFLTVAMTVIYLILLSFRNINYPLGSILISTLYQFLQLCLLVAVAMVFGVFTSSLLATLLTFGVYLMGNLSPDLIKLGSLSNNSNLQKLIQGFYLVFPDLSRLNLKNEAVYNILPPPLTLLSNGVYGLLYTVMLLAIAVLIFSQREF
ncbi:MAG TPA: ABC transporter permease [Cyanobacteria bacterium UBA8553]|nr:ABC transporter permease [Cyanobacteria bacterium UBA8553]HAJ60675.1 ABC transporter permease [Cyanobacteria bacterium UBA8543]